MVTRRRGLRRTSWCAAVALVHTLLVGAVAGCAEHGAAADDHEPDGLAAVRASADALARAGSSRTRTAVRTASGGTRLTVRGRGGFDYAGGRGRLRVTMPAQVSGGPRGAPITELFTPGRLYLKNRGEGVPPDKWVLLRTGTLPDGNLVTSGATDPLRAAELLRGAREVSFEGERRLDGARVRHYRGTADIAAAAAAAARGSRAELDAAARGFSDTEVAFDAFLDEQGRLRKVRHRFSLPHAAARHAGGARDGAVDVTSTTTMYDFGARVRVEPPSEDDLYTGTIAAPMGGSGGREPRRNGS